MWIKKLQCFVLLGMLCLMSVDSGTLSSGQAPKVVVLVEGIERVGQNEARLRVKVTNISTASVFSTGISFSTDDHFLTIYWEQKGERDKWQHVAPCLDVQPPHVIELKPTLSFVKESTLKVPLARICKKRDIKLEGQFRFRVDYFESRVQARRYLEKFFEDGKDKPRATSAFSEPFEIPPFRAGAERSSATR